MATLNRTSYGKTDEDCVILKDKNGAFIARYNVQFIEESTHGLIVCLHISNKNPDSAAFLDMIEPLINKYHPTYRTVDAGMDSRNRKKGKELYSHRGNLCESPNGFIKYNVNGKKLKMNGLTRNKTIMIL